MKKLSLTLLALIASASAHAACTSPAGNAGEIIYDSSRNIPAYCNDTDWVAWGSGYTEKWASTGSDIYYSGGYVGIGNNSPANNLSVGSSSTDWVGISVVSSSDTDAMLQLTSDGTDRNADWIIRQDTSQSNRLDFRYDGAVKFTQSTGGNVAIYGSGTTCVIGNGTGNTACTSDIRMKENITPLPNALDNIVKLEGVSFDWKKSGEHAIGLIAQEVEKIYPEVVSENEETGMKAISYASLVAPLVEAVKELKVELEAAKAEIEALKAKAN